MQTTICTAQSRSYPWALASAAARSKNRQSKADFLESRRNPPPVFVWLEHIRTAIGFSDLTCAQQRPPPVNEEKKTMWIQRIAAEGTQELPIGERVWIRRHMQCIHRPCAHRSHGARHGHGRGVYIAGIEHERRIRVPPSKESQQRTDADEKYQRHRVCVAHDRTQCHGLSSCTENGKQWERDVPWPHDGVPVQHERTQNEQNAEMHPNGRQCGRCRRFAPEQAQSYPQLQNNHRTPHPPDRRRSDRWREERNDRLEERRRDFMKRTPDVHDPKQPAAHAETTRERQADE